MSGALAYLVVRSARNAVVARLRRLTRPRYLLSALAGSLYLAFWVGPFLLRGALPGRGGSAPHLAHPEALVWVETPSAVLLFVLAALAWLWPQQTFPLRFTAAEGAWLLPAPLTRARLVLYKLGRVQLGLGFTSLLLSLYPSRALGIEFGRMALGMFLVLSTLNLHLCGAALERLRWRERGRSDLTFSLRSAVVVGVLGTVLAPVLRALLADLRAGEPLFGGLAVHTLPAAVVLAPFRALVRPLFTAAWDPAAFAAAFGVFALHAVWVPGIDVSLEESVREGGGGERVRGEVAAERRRRRALKAPFRLAERGRPETALVWKNLIAAGRGYRWPALASAVLAVGLVIGIRPLVGDGGLLHDLLYWVFAGAAVGFLLMVLVGPARFRNDLRQDLMQIETIKAFPLSGAAIVLGEVLAPLILMTLLEWTLLALAAAAAPAWAAMTVHRWALPAAVLLPAWNLLSVVEQNGMALIFPSWVALGARRMAGLEAIGQGLLAAVARTLFLLVATLPSGVLFLGVLVFASAMGWPSPRLLAAIAAAVVLLVEAAAGVVLLGARFESFEIEELEARE